jgi:uncharacterized membrane protein YfcA
LGTSPLEISLLAALGFAALGVVVGMLNVLAGGGSLLAMPMLIFAGLPETVANGTARVAILFQNASAIARFHRSGRLDLALAQQLLVPTLLGAAAGAYAATLISDIAFRGILGAVMLAVAAVVVCNPRWLDREMATAGAASPPSLRMGRALVWPAMLAAGFYGGMVQAGVGYVLLAALVLVVRQGLVDANIMKVVLIGCYTLPAVAVFAAQGKVDLTYGLLLAVGQSLGAWLGAALTLSKGAKAIRMALVIAVVLMALKLLGVDTAVLAEIANTL